MTRTELIVRTQERLPEMSFQQVSACCGALLETLFDALADGRNVTLPRLGEFKIKQHRARVGRDSRNGLERVIPSCSVVQFYAHQNLKDRLNNAEQKTEQTV
ncbi:MAG: HU family DNA-binding protein [Desulfovibrio sp.]|nr:HU family DNA-binding protein [Desulfovibrio sp.]